MVKNYKKYIIPYIKQFKGLMILTIFLGVLTFLTSSALTFTSGYLITRAAEMPVNILMIYVPIVLVRAFGVSRPVSRYLERLAGHNTVLKILAKMRVWLWEILEPQALLVRSRFQAGDLIGTLADDIEHLQDAYIRTIFPSVVSLFLYVFTVIAFGIFDWKFALWVCLCLGIMVFLYPLLSLYFHKKRGAILKEKRAGLYRDVSDTVFGLGDWLISGHADRFFRRFIRQAGECDKLEKKMKDWNYSRNFQLQMLTAILLISIGLWAGDQAAKGAILPAYIASFTLVTLPLLEGILPISHAVEMAPVYDESLKRLEIIEKPVIKEGPVLQDTPEPASLPEHPDISIKNLRFRYTQREPYALDGVSIEIPYGRKIALLGRSGSGKTTLMKLLIGAVRPESGRVLIGGIPPGNYGDHIHDLVGILDQKPYLFATTVENNIRLGRRDATKDEILDVVDKVGLGPYLLSLPKGLETQMEERGQRFSGGERHRIALARILLKKTPIVILDEPTVGLDPYTERDLLKTIFDVLRDKTVLLITHHLAGLEQMDEILFLDGGKVEMRGSHPQLLRENERYRNLYRMDDGGWLTEG